MLYSKRACTFDMTMVSHVLQTTRYTFLQGIRFNGLYQCDDIGFFPAISAEFCESEIFNATCSTGSVILMAHAYYGRMQKCRCVQVNYGYIGCKANVLELMDTRCSGRRRCEVRVPEMMLTNARPCQNDLKSYLEASYRCVKGKTIKL